MLCGVHSSYMTVMEGLYVCVVNDVRYGHATSVNERGVNLSGRSAPAAWITSRCRRGWIRGITPATARPLTSMPSGINRAGVRHHIPAGEGRKEQSKIEILQ